jgi:redox-sensitive bicupin YhaK (pirin superfamily)
VSNLDPAVMQAVGILEARKAAIGDGTEVRRLLPQRTLRTVGAWCFLDHYGPDDVSTGPGMQVPPHPHIGLQTVSWLFEGLVLHRDSLGSRQMIRPGELNLMTAGPGIALIAPGLLAHLPAGLSQIRLSPADGRRHARFFVLGGAPFGERLLMWWNFVGRSGEEIAQAREDWVAGRFGEVRGYPGEPLAAPPLPTVPLKPR